MGWLTNLFNRPKVENQPTEPVPAATRAETNPVGEELQTAQPAQPAQPAQTWKSYKVAGTSFRAESIREMAEENPDYGLTKREIISEGLDGERIYEFIFDAGRPELVPEPENPHDSKAIKVIVNGTHIGYVKAGSCAHIHKLLKEKRIADISCTIGGGKYKQVRSEWDDHRETEAYYMEQNEIPLFARLDILEITPTKKA